MEPVVTLHQLALCDIWYKEMIKTQEAALEKTNDFSLHHSAATMLLLAFQTFPPAAPPPPPPPSIHLYAVILTRCLLRT